MFVVTTGGNDDNNNPDVFTLAELQLQLAHELPRACKVLMDDECLCIVDYRFGAYAYVYLSDDGTVADLAFETSCPPHIAAEIAITVDNILPAFVTDDEFNHT